MGGSEAALLVQKLVAKSSRLLAGRIRQDNECSLWPRRSTIYTCCHVLQRRVASVRQSTRQHVATYPVRAIVCRSRGRITQASIVGDMVRRAVRGRLVCGDALGQARGALIVLLSA